MATHDMSELEAGLVSDVNAAFPGTISDPADRSGPVMPVELHVQFARFLKEECGYALYVSVIATHFPDEQPKGKRGEEPPPLIPEHYEVATVLRNPTAQGSPHFWWRVCLRPGEECPTLVPLFAGADWQEREQFDLVGVRFTDHPDMRRLMMPEDWVGHPLHKGYAIDTPHSPWR